jgi:hypothetical protein
MAALASGGFTASESAVREPSPEEPAALLLATVNRRPVAKLRPAATRSSSARDRVLEEFSGLRPPRRLLEDLVPLR